MAIHGEPQQPCKTCGTCPTCGNRPTPTVYPDWTYRPQPSINPLYPYPSPNIMWGGRTWTSDTTSPLDLQSKMVNSVQGNINIGSGGIPINKTTEHTTAAASVALMSLLQALDRAGLAAEDPD